MKDIKIINLIKLYTLLLLSQGPKHGYEIIKELEDKLDKKISTSHIYPFFEQLKKNKVLIIERHKEKNRKTYQLTEKGKNLTKSMINRFAGLIDIAIEPRLKVCIHCACKVYEGGHNEILNKKKLVFCCKHCASTYKKLVKTY
ncbi:MAG: PadR family transcriptional regulator [Nanoarchaeota archaeon]|nr:PadR family transcriptional regulator [Nanoarchaeota archaeon]